MASTLKKEIWDQSKEWINAIGDVVNEMASKLGIATEHVYTIYTKQMFYQGLLEIVSSLIFVAFLFIILKYGLKKLKPTIVEDENEKKSSEEITGTEIYMIVAVVSTIIFVVITGFQINDIKDGAMMAFNPEYYTIRDLVDTVKDLISEQKTTGQ